VVSKMGKNEDARILLLARAVRRLLYHAALEANQEERAEFEALLAEVDCLITEGAGGE